MKKHSEKIVEYRPRVPGLSTIVERNFYNIVYFLGPWMNDEQMSTFDLKAIQSFGAGYRSRGGVEVKSLASPSLDDLPAVAYGTTQHHTEDHPNDLLRGKQIFNKKNLFHSQKSVCLPLCSSDSP